MAILSRSAILSADDFVFANVPCPEWGGDVRVRGLTAADQQYIAKLNKEEKTDEMTLAVFIRGVVDENGDRIFDSKDRDELRKRSFAVIDRCAQKIAELTGRSDPDGIEAARKN